MENLHDKTIACFSAPKDYFWHWTEEGTVIEFARGQTICFKEELINHLSPEYITTPPLSVLLIILMIGKMDRQSKEGITPEILKQELWRAMINPESWLYRSSPEDLPRDTNTLHSFVDLLYPLSRQYWQEGKRTILFNCLFGQIPLALANGWGKEMLAIFRQLPPEDYCAPRIDDNNWSNKQAGDDLRVMSRILQKYPYTDVLEQELEALIKTPPAPPPAPAPIEMPEELPLPAQAGEKDLLQELTEDERTAYIALLTQQLMAAIHLPMHTNRAGDMTIGGVSDITNKGAIDKLLLSELANEDDVLMARLANNEALYLRREEIPDKMHTHRFILIDTSIKMWGTPHMLAISTALACIMDKKQQATITSYALAGDQSTAIDLTNKNDIVKAMHLLSPALRSANALFAFNELHTLNSNQEFFLITSEELFHETLFQQAFVTLRPHNGFLVTVNRDATVQLYRYLSGHRKLVSRACINMQQPVPRTKKQGARHGFRGAPTILDIPRFLEQLPFPLLLPARRGYGYNGIASTEHAGICITDQRQFVYWQNEHKGALEIMSLFPEAYMSVYNYGHDEKNFFIQFRDRHSQEFIVCHFDKTTRQLSTKAVTNKLKEKTVAKIHRTIFSITDKAFIFETANGICILDVYSGELTNVVPSLTTEDIDRLRTETLKTTRTNSTSAARYDMLSKVKHISINDKGNFVINRHELVFSQQKVELIPVTEPLPVHNIVSTAQKLKIKDLRQPLFRYRWPDGSEAWFDTVRHMLYLRSSNKSLPEIALPVMVNVGIACWASNGDICGHPYLRPDDAKVVEVMAFHQKYIRPFIHIIQKYGTAAAI
ncbi:hypothetical protein [Chitinophaga pinensis]|uniref:MoxR-vWA-beta-propeller ternary system domain-containing protein n=1 Tax=Chitinophaga pinensis (strain ATCC 43595 / DSM 2588 / LMG 13176 / NBRC 15968 / NCIMB 11800 / UQM 2034) TaxID=485918 RepID=A0A979G967_CHIPD|nr:hypothetical protein [Chitinophaga pinensis]ACU63249.1 hypothetical protein Cpin_5830 [Chitinophaga pinensis DSM 2588]